MSLSRIFYGRALILCVVAAVLVAGSTMLLGKQAEAAITTAFSSRFEANVNGSIILRGNTNLVCPAASSGCTNAQNGAGSGGETLNNNGYAMRAADADGDAATFNDSRATVDIPAGATVLFAGLYWSADPSAGANGSAAPTPAAKNRVLFRTPTASSWQQITAGTLYTDGSIAAYQGFADVTGQVAGAGSGVYSVANIQAGTGNDRYAGWALAIAYQKAGEPMHSLRVFDGFGVVSSSSTQVHIPVSGFQTPQNGTVKAKIGTVVYEGDLGKTGDSLQLDGQPMSDAANPATNFFNSTVSDGGSTINTGRTPGNQNLMGVDIDQFDATGKLGNNVQNADLVLTTGDETFYPGVVTFTTDLYAPELVADVGGTDVNGGDLLPGDEIEYRIDVRNNGTDTAEAAVVSDAVPTHTTYVPGSLKIKGVAVSDDANDGDPGKFATGTATWGVGTSPNGTAGGQVPYQATTYVTFRVKVDADTPVGYQILDLANLAYQASYNPRSITGVSGSAGMIVRQPTVDLAAALTVAPAVVQRATLPSAVGYTAKVTNNGPGLEPAAVAKLTLPAGVTAGTLPSGCSAAGQVVTCAAGQLIAGTAKTFVIPATAAATADPAATAGLVVSGTGQDTDSGNNSAAATLRVNSAPRAVDDTATTANGAAVSIAVRDNDTDADDPAGSLTVSVVQAPAHGTAVPLANGTIRYTPAAGWTGADTFTYQVTDGNGGVSAATVTVTTTSPAPAPVDAPPVAADESVQTDCNTPVRIDVLADATDPDAGDVLRVSGTTNGTHGTVVRNSDGSITYTPDDGFSGTDSFDYTVKDGHGGTDTATVTVVVANGVPTALADAVTVPANATAVIDVLVNDGDPNGDPLTVTVDVAPQHGTATPLGDGRVSYVPAAGYHGTDTFHYKVADGHGGSAGATVTVGVINSAPDARPDAAVTDTDTAVTIPVLLNDADPNGDQVSITATTAAGHGTVTRDAGGTLTYTPADGFFGTDTFTYTVRDPLGLTASAIVTVTVGDAPPIAVADRFVVHPGETSTLDLLGNDRDPNTGQPLRVATVGPAGKGTATLAADGTVTYRPDAMTSGVDTFDYVVTDDLGLTSTATVTLEITAPPAVPGTLPVVPDKAVQAKPGTALTIKLPTTDQNGKAVTVRSIGKPRHGTAKLNADGTVTYLAAAGYTGTDSLTYEVVDADGNVASASITITVTGRNKTPVAVGDRVSVPAGRSIAMSPLTNDTDPNGDKLTITKIGKPRHGTAVLSADGTVTYAPSPGYDGGTDSFAYYVSDGHGGTAQAIITVTVLPAATTGGSGGNLAKTGVNALSVAAAGMLAVVLGGVLYLGSLRGGTRIPALAAAGVGIAGTGPGRHRPGRHRG